MSMKPVSCTSPPKCLQVRPWAPSWNETITQHTARISGIAETVKTRGNIWAMPDHWVMVTHTAARITAAEKTTNWGVKRNRSRRSSRVNDASGSNRARRRYSGLPRIRPWGRCFETAGSTFSRSPGSPAPLEEDRQRPPRRPATEPFFAPPPHRLERRLAVEVLGDVPRGIAETIIAPARRILDDQRESAGRLLAADGQIASKPRRRGHHGAVRWLLRRENPTRPTLAGPGVPQRWSPGARERSPGDHFGRLDQEPVEPDL